MNLHTFKKSQYNHYYNGKTKIQAHIKYIFKLNILDASIYA